MAGVVAGMVANEVGGDRVKPTGKGMGGVEAEGVAKDADEGFLGEFLGLGMVMEEAQEVMVKALGMTFHEAVEGGFVAGRQVGHFPAILGVSGVPGVHAKPRVASPVRDPCGRFSL